MKEQQAVPRPKTTINHSPQAFYNIIIPGEPIAWKRTGRNGTRYYDQQTHEKIAWAALFRRSFTRPPLTCGLKVHVVFKMRVFNSLANRHGERMEGMPYSRKPDGDNLTKFLFDSLNGVAWKDDALIASYTNDKVWSYTPQTIISIEELEESY